MVGRVLLTGRRLAQGYSAVSTAQVSWYVMRSLAYGPTTANTNRRKTPSLLDLLGVYSVRVECDCSSVAAMLCLAVLLDVVHCVFSESRHCLSPQSRSYQYEHGCWMPPGPTDYLIWSNMV